MSKRPKVTDRGPLIKGAELFFEQTKPEEPKSPAEVGLEPEATPRQLLIKLIGYIEPDDAAWLEAYAKSRQVSKAHVIRHIIKRYRAEVENRG